MNTEIMVPGHPRWCEFLDELSKASRCARTTEHARAVLVAMEGVDASASLRALQELGGTCDCAILFDLVNRDTARA
jgi:hypothetical protein